MSKEWSEKGEQQGHLHREYNSVLNTMSLCQLNDASTGVSFRRYRLWVLPRGMAGRKPSQLSMGSSGAPRKHCLRGKWPGWDQWAAATEKSPALDRGKNLEDHRAEWSTAEWPSAADRRTCQGRLNQSPHPRILPRTGLTQIFCFSRFLGSHHWDPGESAIKEAGGREGSRCLPGTFGLQEQELHICVAWMPNWSYQGIPHYHFASLCTDKP